jgi:hypothetical protein
LATRRAKKLSGLMRLPVAEQSLPIIIPMFHLLLDENRDG